MHDVRYRLRRAFLQFEPRKISPGARTGLAAVLIPLFESASRLECLMIARVRKAGDPWSGQVAFPGGMREESDRSLLDTAIREAREEVGIKVDRSDILGSLSDVKGHIDVIVTPYVALLKKQQRLVMSEEVESILRVPLETFQRWHFRSIKANDETTLKRRCYVSGNYIIWGLSRRIAEELTKLVSNLPRNSDGQKRTT